MFHALIQLTRTGRGWTAAQEKGGVADWGPAPPTHPPSVIYLLPIKRCFPALTGCLVSQHSRYSDQSIRHETHLKDVQISAQQKCTLAGFGHHGNCLHHSAPCCVSMSLTYKPARARAQIFKTLRAVHQNLSGNKSDSFCLATLLSSCYT